MLIIMASPRVDDTGTSLTAKASMVWSGERVRLRRAPRGQGQDLGPWADAA
jgi:hypothetical protein